MLAQSPTGAPPPTPHLTILNTYLKPTLLTSLEKRVKKKTVVAMKELSQQTQETKCRRERLLKDSRQLLEEKYRVQAENQLFKEYLRKNKEQCEKKQEELWAQYVQECGEIERERQELASGFNRRNAALQAQLLQGRKTQKDLKQQLQALKPVYKVKEKQDMKIQTLEKEQEKIRGETAAKDQEAHFRFLREKALMEKELGEWRLMELGQINTTGLRRKYKALALAAKQAHSEFCGSLQRENQQLHKELQQLSQEFRRLDAVRSRLERHRQLVKEQQWYLEALTRGRQRLQAERERHHHSSHNPRLKEQRASKTMLSAKPRTRSK